MKRVYSATDLIDAQLLADALNEARIATHLLNAHAIGAQGDLPFASTYPEVWICNERDSARAASIVREHERRPLLAGSARCAHCAESSPGNFALCWQCGHALDAPAGAHDAAQAQR